MDFGLTGKVIWVGGASRGIGRAIAMTFAELGAEVIAVARDEAALSALLTELPAPNGQRHEYAVVDYQSRQQIEQALAQITEQRTGVDVIINNTGGPPGGRLLDAKPEAFMAAFEQHLLANHLIAQALIPHMKAQRYGRIINILSTSVKVPIPFLGVSNTIRAAVANWAKTLVNGVSPYGITVNNILPGYIETDRLHSLSEGVAKRRDIEAAAVIAEWKQAVPLRRIGQAHELAMAAAFLASPLASYINGVSLPVDGGRTPCY